MARPPDIHIDDLANPVLPEAVRTMNDVSAEEAGRRVPLDEASLFAEASERAGGLTDFGPDDFREGLGVLLPALETEADLSLMGRLSARGQIVRLLSNRLLVEAAIARHPEALERPIERPVLIVGLPRTGTSHLHNLLSVHPELRFLPYWEATEPVPLPGETAEPGPRAERAQAGLDQGGQLTPHQQAMHELDAWTPHEEIGFLLMAFACSNFATMFRAPSYTEWYCRRDHTPAYAYTKRVLQLVSFLRDGGKRWVLKSPMHLENIGPLLRIYPDARFVMTFRDPARVVLSLAYMTAYNRRLTARRVDPIEISRLVEEMNRHRLAAAVRDAGLVPADQLQRVHFDAYMKDPIEAARRVLEFAGLDASDATLDRLRRYQDEHPRGKLGRVVYRYEDVGLDPESIRAGAREYMETFGVAREAD
ncbi:MAG: sulfotransferase [Spirochaetaceae bacterium]|nr:sulfotransferase [Myxococcales bacterium]MCB9724890.1 sulfotransferase [Spirochaetaceae bacterium]